MDFENKKQQKKTKQTYVQQEGQAYYKLFQSQVDRNEHEWALTFSCVSLLSCAVRMPSITQILSEILPL